jgi:CheY-like chemotaxis protein
LYQILIVEDDADVAQLLQTVLGERHEVRIAGDGDEALACAVGFVPDVAVVDLGLPGMDGFQVARRLRNLFGGSVRLVAFSGWQHVSPDQAMSAGFDVMLHKPASTERLLRAVEG